MNHVCCSDRLTKIKFTHTCDQLFKAKFEAISFLTDVSNYCEPQKIKLFIYIYLKISRNIGSNFMDFWQFLVSFGISVSKFPAFYEHNRARPIPEISRENLSLVEPVLQGIHGWGGGGGELDVVCRVFL